MNLIAQRIKETIDKNEATQIELAKAIDVNPKQIQRWKTGEQEMSIAKLRKFCQFYGVSADYILGLKEPK